MEKELTMKRRRAVPESVPIADCPRLVATLEKVNHPSHYNQIPGVECIDVVEHMPFNIGNAVKYLWRVGKKPGVDAIEDLRKAAWYVTREIEKIEKERT